MHIHQIADFLLGWFGLDIMKDDVKAAKAAAPAAGSGPPAEAKPGK